MEITIGVFVVVIGLLAAFVIMLLVKVSQHVRDISDLTDWTISLQRDVQELRNAIQQDIVPEEAEYVIDDDDMPSELLIPISDAVDCVRCVVDEKVSNPLLAEELITDIEDAMYTSVFPQTKEERDV